MLQSRVVACLPLAPIALGRAPLRPFSPLIVAGLLLTTAPAWSQASRPPNHADDAFDFMNLLSKLGWHDYEHETWNAYGQVTWISSLKAPFHAAYNNLNGSNMSLVPTFEHSFTGSATLYLGMRLWQGTEVYYVPEVIAENPLSHLRGIGGSIQNFELQKGGSKMPQIYRARAYVQQTIGLGGKKSWKSSDPMQLESRLDSRRVVFRVGNFSILDFMDKNEFAGDPRQQFFNMAFMTYSAYDFGSDARGLSLGGVVEFYYDDWALRLGRITPPKNPNDLNFELRLDRHFGDQVEIEHRHELLGQSGAVRVLGYRNRLRTGRFDDAIAAFEADPTGKNAATCPGYHYDSTNANAPDLCWARKTNNKVGFGLSIEQHFTEDLGISVRGMLSDGKTEVYAYTPTDYSIAAALLSKGRPWRRPRDLAGVGFAANFISSSHARYLGMGGVDGFIGDGKIRQAAESVAELFYSLNVASWVWLSLDYQHLMNPAFNADRGPVEIFAGRAHAEF
jgi:high affinity Mn2+ porin